MSDQVRGLFVERRARTRPLFQPTDVLAWVVGLACLLLFGLAADRVVETGYVAPLIARVWAGNAVPVAIGGQWLVALLVQLIRIIPGSGPELLVVVTIIVAALLLGLLARNLRRRGWPTTEASLCPLLIALHPVSLYLATTGGTLLLVAALVGFLVLAVDRAEAIGDAQSLMGLGLASAAMFITTPNAIYLIAPILTLLPVALRDIQSGGAALALFTLALVPTIVVVGGILIATGSLGLGIGDVTQIWSSPLHGQIDPAALSTPWIVAYGGRPGEALLNLLFLCAVTTPPVLVVALRLIASRAERLRPTTALLTLLLPALSGACAALFWHINSPWGSLALSITCLAAWAMASTLRNWERQLWLVLMLAGDIAAWTTPLLWAEADKSAWLRALL